MTHTEITLAQLEIMRDIATYMPTFLMGLPKEDDEETYKAKLIMSNSETDQLVALGFIEDVSKYSQVSIGELEKTNGRKYRIFRITEVGLAFFKASTSQLVN